MNQSLLHEDEFEVDLQQSPGDLTVAAPVATKAKATNSAEHLRKLPWVARLTFLHFLYLALLVLVREREGQNWLSLLYAYTPPIVLMVPSVLAVIFSSFRYRNNYAFINLGLWMLGTMAVLGLRFGETTDRFNERDRRETPIKVMTFNVQTAKRGADGVVEAIRAANPHVFMLQEAEEAGTPFHAKLRALPGYRVLIDGGMAFGTRLPVLKHTTSALPNNPTHRPIQHVDVDLGGRQIHFLNVHLLPSRVDSTLLSAPASLPSYIVDLAQRQSAQIDALMRVATKLPFNAIIGGDFNSPPATPPYRSMTLGYRDSHTVAGNGYGYTMPSNFPISRVDYVWVPTNFGIVNSEVLDTKASDHRPLVAEVVPLWKAPRSADALPK